ncbi:PRTase-like protein [Rhizoclosmatium globosum]|uniref:PRTase-like protein n=1 Tax=Rhizoclosmatium globosum TaxID=329046 RepID=A0A1Y2D3M0_9FUNG|nr:PRTase-like protein [Rhizoclosmatium globosum]|eukprot:ORY53807.1 PRTase-like protein [Rhizoclosmatium globosum]
MYSKHSPQNRFQDSQIQPHLARVLLDRESLFGCELNLEVQNGNMKLKNTMMNVPFGYRASKHKDICDPEHYKDDISSVLIPHGLIINRIEKIAQDIAKDYQGPITACCVLKGASVFYADLMNALRKVKTPDQGSVQFSYEFMKVKSYHNTESTGEVKISLTEDELKSYKGKHLLIVEDIVDTGVTCLHAPQENREKQRIVPDYFGFSVPDYFVIGYGLDYNEYFREMEHICIISESGIEKYKS